MEAETLKLEIERRLVYDFSYDLIRFNDKGKELFESLSKIKGKYYVVVYSGDTGSRTYNVKVSLFVTNMNSFKNVKSKHFRQLYFEFESKNEYLKWKLKV